MKIQEYGFGRIVIDGRQFNHDLIIHADRVSGPWWRIKGHRLAAEDLDQVLASRPQRLVVGSGYFGRLQVPAATREMLQAQGIQLEVLKTAAAVARLQELQAQSAAVVGALHLTC